MCVTANTLRQWAQQRGRLAAMQAPVIGADVLLEDLLTTAWAYELVPQWRMETAIYAQAARLVLEQRSALLQRDADVRRLELRIAELERAAADRDVRELADQEHLAEQLTMVLPLASTVIRMPSRLRAGPSDGGASVGLAGETLSDAASSVGGQGSPAVQVSGVPGADSRPGGVAVLASLGVRRVG